MKIAKNFVDACYEAGVAIHKEELGELAIQAAVRASITAVSGVTSAEIETVSGNSSDTQSGAGLPVLAGTWAA